MVPSCTLVVWPGLVLGDSIGNVGHTGYTPAGNTGKWRENFLLLLHLCSYSIMFKWQDQ